MVKKSSGHAKEKGMRIHEDDLSDIKLLKQTFMLKTDGDVIHKLIGMYKQGKIGNPSFLVKRTMENQCYDSSLQTTLDEYKSLYQDAMQINTRNVKRFQLISEKYKIPMAEIMETVK